MYHTLFSRAEAPKAARVETHYYQLAHYNLGMTISLLILNIIIVGLRFWARRKQGTKVQIDDWLTLPALVLIIGASATMMTSISKHAMGYEIPRPASEAQADLDLAIKPVQITSQSEFAINLLGTLALGCVKASFLFFYSRIFCSKLSKVRFVINGMLVFVGLWTISFFFSHLFSCGTNFSAFWTSFESLRTKCVDTFKEEYAFVVTDFLTDVFILVIPMPLVWRLQLGMGRKIAVIFVFLLGSGAVAASATRMAFVIKAINNGFVVEDGDLVVTGVVSFLLLELHLALLAACLPTVRYLFKGLSPESVLSSLRSAISLHSLRSTRSRIHDDEGGPSQGPRGMQPDSTSLEAIASKEAAKDSKASQREQV